MKQILSSTALIVVTFLVLSSAYGEMEGPFWVLFLSKSISLFSIVLFFAGLCSLAHHSQRQKERGMPLLYQSLGFPLRQLLRFPLMIAILVSGTALLGENIAFPWLQQKLQTYLTTNEITIEKGQSIPVELGLLYRDDKSFYLLGEGWVLRAKHLRWLDSLECEGAEFYSDEGLYWRAHSLAVPIEKPELVQRWYRESSLSWSLEGQKENKEFYKRTTIPLAFVFLCLLVYRFVLRYARAMAFSGGGVLLFWSMVRLGDQLEQWSALGAALFPFTSLLALFVLSMVFWREG
ncbi:MAG: hypothetical protein VX278_05510 [Myxococcota bacterium]|nr:hypothetical protein [Myxococcota bacterium]